MIRIHEDDERGHEATTPASFPARMTEEETAAEAAPVEIVPSHPISPIPPIPPNPVSTRPLSDLQLQGTPDSVRAWVQHAARFERAKTACQVMAGFELIEIKRSMGFVQGGRRGQKPNDSVFASWEEWVPAHCGISADTARNWMKMAEALKPRLRKLPGLGGIIREIIDVPLSQWPEEKCRLLTDAVHKLADGRGQLEFMLELGIVKRPQGASAQGGDLGGARVLPGATGEEAARQIARDDWSAVAQKIQLARQSFTLLDDPEVDALIACFDAAAAAMRRWRQAPRALRNAALVAEVAELLKG